MNAAGSDVAVKSDAKETSSNDGGKNGGDIEELSLDMASCIANSAVSTIKRNGFNPVSVYVLDASGSTLVMMRMDGCSSCGIPDFAHGKAWSCIAMKSSSRTFRDKYTGEDNVGRYCQMLSMVNISDGKMMPCPGGALIKNASGKILGAVGVSGASADEDEYAALRGVADSGYSLVTVPAMEEHQCTTNVKDQ